MNERIILTILALTIYLQSSVQEDRPQYLGIQLNVFENSNELVSSYILQHNNWNESFLICPTQGLVDLETLSSKNIILRGKWGCLNNVRAPKHSRNQFLQRPAPQSVTSSEFLSGTTYYINEFMAVGHSIMDIEIIQVLKSSAVERIVLQRAPCTTEDLCNHDFGFLGTWLSFFQAFYAIMVTAFRPGIALYMRFNDQDYLSAYYLSFNRSDGSIIERHEESNRLALRGELCFETVVRSPRGVAHNLANKDSVSNLAANEFRRSAYDLVQAHTSTKLDDFVSSKAPIVISYIHRSVLDRRHPANPEIVTDLLRLKFPAPQFEIRLTPINGTVTHVQQIKWMAESMVVISDHGGFNSNIVYMRNESLFIMLRGNYKLGFEHDYIVAHVAKSFGVFLKFVVMNDLQEHGNQRSYNISEVEAKHVVAVVDSYANHILIKN